MPTTTIPHVVTTTATVTTDGLSLSPEFMAELNLPCGTKITITVPGKSSDVPPDVEEVIDRLCGMFEGGPSMTDALLERRKQDELLTEW